MVLHCDSLLTVLSAACEICIACAYASSASLFTSAAKTSVAVLFSSMIHLSFFCFLCLSESECSLSAISLSVCSISLCYWIGPSDYSICLTWYGCCFTCVPLSCDSLSCTPVLCLLIASLSVLAVAVGWILDVPPLFSTAFLHLLMSWPMLPQLDYLQVTCQSNHELSFRKTPIWTETNLFADEIDITLLVHLQGFPLPVIEEITK